MTNILLHIGAGKCGSSALQAALTANPILPLLAGGFRTYTCIGNDGRVIAGRNIVPNRIFGYRTSVNARELGGRPDSVFTNARAALEQVEQPIMSNEGLLCGHVDGRVFLDRLGLPVDVVAYVRPQVEYFNSAWWQWGAWSDAAHDPWTVQRIKRSQYHTYLSEWAAIPQVRSVTVRLLPTDVVTDFLTTFGVDTADLPPPVRTNSSLPSAVLRLLQRNKYLYFRYPGQLDFVLPRLVALDRLAKAPWVVDQTLARRIVNRTRDGNLKLLEMLDPDSAAIMRADPRWWDAAVYADRTVESFDPPEPESSETERLAVALIEAILDRAPKA